MCKYVGVDEYTAMVERPRRWSWSRGHDDLCGFVLV